MPVHKEWLRRRSVQFNRLKKTNYIITVSPTLYYTCVHNFSQNLCFLHYWYHIVCMFIVTYFIAVCIEEVLVSAPWKWRYTNAEICISYVKNHTHKSCNSVFFGDTWVFKFKSSADDFHSHLNNNCFGTRRAMYEDLYILGTEIIYFRIYDRHRQWAVFFSSLC